MKSCLEQETSKKNEVEDKKLFIYALVVLFGGNITGIINSISPDYRADSFTGSQGRDLKDELQRQINDIKSNDAECKERVNTLTELINQHRHEAPPRWVIENLKHIEEEIHDIKETLKR